MSTPCKNTHPLKRSGVNQAQRVLAALTPGFVKIDERQYPDLILFARNYASHLSYYNRHHQIEGDWTPFMLMDVSVTLASISHLPMGTYTGYVKRINALLTNTDSSNESDLKKYFKLIFDLGYSLTVLLDSYYRSLPDDFSFRDLIGNAVHSGLPEYFARLTAYYHEAIAQGLVDPDETFQLDDRPQNLLLSQDFQPAGLSPIWTKPSLPPFTATFNGSSVALKIRNASTHNLFTGIMEQYLKVLGRIIEAAPAHLDRTLDKFPEHSPHYTLFLTFIKLFKKAQDSLNTFTARHLDLYYREVLKLEKKSPEPDSVHLLFELAKTAGSGVLLEAGTVFKAGKDKDGKELFYRLPEPALLGKGKVAALKNVFADRTGLNYRISASSIANSEDGAGAPLTRTDQSWSPFGGPDRPAARSGFAIASDYLYLREGNREITVDFQLAAGHVLTSDQHVLEKLFDIRLSAEDDWLTVSPEARKLTVAPDQKSFSIQVTLDGGDPALVPWSEAVHGYRFEQALPTALFTLANGAAPEDLWNLRLTGMTLRVKVDGYKSLWLENDEGALNPAKPFDLFGSFPRYGSAFILGCPELFMKARKPEGHVEARLFMDWDNYPALKKMGNHNPTLEMHYLEDARWKEDKGFSDSLFSFYRRYPRGNSTLSFTLPALDVGLDFSEGANYSPAAKWGFLKLVLQDDFGHADYAKKLAESIEVVSVTENGTTTTSVEMGTVTEPYTPRLKEIRLNYEASTRLDLFAGEPVFFHLTPFGHAASTLTGTGVESEPHLLPQYPNEGELFIGMEQLQTGQTLSLLFQLAEGTADPLAEKQALTWHYLGPGSRWVRFEKEAVADATGGLLKSGIVKLAIPADASYPGALMEEQLHWIKICAEKNTHAFPRLISVQAQAALARHHDHKQEGNYYKEPLPAGTISKLLLSNPAIKKVEQPGASFGGRTREDDRSWYRRVSERLRHKQRAVAMWDYERLVLEEFPEIYKVKCMSHAQMNNELSPGHVLLVPVPDLHGKKAYDPLRPRVSLGLLEDIKKFLSGLVSPHVELAVCNPVFEEVQLEFNIQYRSDDTDFFTRQLRSELEQFLAPWAFDTEGDLEFGAGVTKSALINFIEERPYVDYLSCVRMYQIVDGKRSNDLEEALAGSCRSVIVSVKADDPVYSHIINESVCTC